jgi:hypothetical protein
MRVQVVVPASLLLLSLTGLAHAEGQADRPSDKPVRRSDFTFGASGGLAFGRASGYPNKVQDLGDPAFKSNTHLALGSARMFWLGVAFNDYLTFGFAFGAASLSGNNRTAKAGLFGFHIDAYPLFDVDPNLRDLAVFGHFGTGPLTITGGPNEANGGLVAYVEGGLAYERLRFWRFGFGPTLSVQHLWSETATSTEGVAGLRLAFYGGP